MLLLIFFALAMDSARGDSPTMDEQNHIARGLAYLRTGDPRLSTEHPPLVNSLCALPLLTQPVRLPTDDWSWSAGEWYRFADQLLWYANDDAERIVFLARLPVMFLGLLLGAFLYRATRWWVGEAAGGRRVICRWWRCCYMSLTQTSLRTATMSPLIWGLPRLSFGRRCIVARCPIRFPAWAGCPGRGCVRAGAQRQALGGGLWPDIRAGGGCQPVWPLAAMPA